MDNEKKQLFIGDKREGVEISYAKGLNTLYFSAYYEGCCGADNFEVSLEMPLNDFCQRLGITSESLPAKQGGQ